MKIIGISGKKQSGKSTLSDLLLNRLSSSVEVCFADKLKEVVRDIFIEPVQGGYIDLSILDNEQFKNTKHPCGLTYREILQQVGTDSLRKLWPEIWLANYKYVVKTLNSNYDYIVTPDVRFINEAELVKRNGGILVRLTRNPLNDKHESETALDGYNKWDLTIDDKTTPEQSCDMVMKLIGFNILSKSDSIRKIETLSYRPEKAK